jgi:hypothetical protein
MKDQPPNRLTVSVRSYTERIEEPGINRKFYEDTVPASPWSLIFDTETTTDERHALRFGFYQIRDGGTLKESGVFYHPAELSKKDVALIKRFAASHKLDCQTHAEFLDRVFIGLGYELGAAYIGLNLPFDLSRLAIGHTDSKPSRSSHAMVGGFSFRYSIDERRPRIQVKHLNGRCSLIRFTVPRQPQQTPGGGRRRGIRSADKRGHFVDLRSLASALLSGSWNLAGLADFLQTEHRKLEADEHGKITETYLEYAMQDVQVTWECYVKLAERYQALKLDAKVERIISEASVGKAYLTQMKVKPWRELQPDFPRRIVGAAMASYYGGRAEVHARRIAVPAVYLDFLSMYPTVCVLMKIWSFVIAKGMRAVTATAWAEEFLNAVRPLDLQKPDTWRKLTVLVKVQPERDIFPVRAKYDGLNRSIGLNELSSDQPMWFTLADCIASKLLTGKAPKVVEAIAFRPMEPQAGLVPVAVAGNTEYSVNPYDQDFYKRLIELRASVKGKSKDVGEDEAKQFDAEQMALKICANATSYGVFAELNPNTHGTPVRQICYGNSDEPFETSTKQVEEPGRFFNPVIATLITGAARLMLALCEKLAEGERLTWAFCDTDGIALTPGPIPCVRTLYERVETVREWFRPLSPYEGKPDILKLEDENFAVECGCLTGRLEQLYCYGVSAKRYSLFNVREDGSIVLRKATAHGLGHILEPYEDEEAPKWIPKPEIDLSKYGLRRWQHDLWHVIVRAGLSETPLQVDLSSLPGFDRPAASRYAATTPDLLGWFSKFNDGKDYAKRVRPFGFMLSYQARHELGTEAPRASAPFDKDPVKGAARCFDRQTGEPIPASQLKTIREALAQFHLHPESKFNLGDYTESGFTERRHVHAVSIEHIGKESNRWEDSFALGEALAVELEYGESPNEYQARLESLIARGKPYSRRRLAFVSGVCLSEVQRIMNREVQPTTETIGNLLEGLGKIERVDRQRAGSSPIISQLESNRALEPKR